MEWKEHTIVPGSALADSNFLPISRCLELASLAIGLFNGVFGLLGACLVQALGGDVDVVGALSFDKALCDAAD
jgi:hypothetical protein